MSETLYKECATEESDDKNNSIDANTNLRLLSHTQFEMDMEIKTEEHAECTTSLMGSQKTQNNQGKKDIMAFFSPSVRTYKNNRSNCNQDIISKRTVNQENKRKLRLRLPKTSSSSGHSLRRTSVLHRAILVPGIAPSMARRQRKHDIKKRFGKSFSRKWEQKNNTGRKPCNFLLVFDPNGRFCYFWSAAVSLAFIYNLWVIVFRFAFSEINSKNLLQWFVLDYSADLIYILDIIVNLRTGFLQDGVLQTDPVALRRHYLNTSTFYLDCLSLLPLDFLYLSVGFHSLLRGFRLIKVYQFLKFLDRTERHTKWPNVIRTTKLVHYILVLFHWNACLFYEVIFKLEDSTAAEIWGYLREMRNDTLYQYLHSLYLSTVTLCNLGHDRLELRNKGEYLFVILEMTFGLLLFASILGHMANIVANVSAARREFQAHLDALKTYMTQRHVPPKLHDRVIRWFDYLWTSKKSTDEEKTLALLPAKIKAEIAIHVHLDTLKRVEIFQNTEAGFLRELVLKLVPVLFSPGDFVCRKGEVGKEMYIVKEGKLQVVADDNRTVLATLTPGSYFGELSILNMGTVGNRRTASVKSIGFSDLFCLMKDDLWSVLKEYPSARVRLEAIATKRMRAFNKEPYKKVAIPRSASAPGLIEATGKVSLLQQNLSGPFKPKHMYVEREKHLEQSKIENTSRSLTGSLIKVSVAQMPQNNCFIEHIQKAFPLVSNREAGSKTPSLTGSRTSIVVTNLNEETKPDQQPITRTSPNQPTPNETIHQPVYSYFALVPCTSEGNLNRTIPLPMFPFLPQSVLPQALPHVQYQTQTNSRTPRQPQQDNNDPILDELKQMRERIENLEFENHTLSNELRSRDSDTCVGLRISRIQEHVHVDIDQPESSKDKLTYSSHTANTEI